MARRYDPATPGRFPADFQARCRRLQDREHPLSISVNGPFWQLREWCGLENLCCSWSMTRLWQTWRTSGPSCGPHQPVLEYVDPDQVMVSEDMATSCIAWRFPRRWRSDSCCPRGSAGGG